ncbi:MAG: hypothetical protein AMJ69_06415 [Gammaproteobacteria bacterium SG8_47]|nr:MAG: hypothetical protein AMJ69_06415 [Gammaproteobacteria bacterium SG8_47]
MLALLALSSVQQSHAAHEIAVSAEQIEHLGITLVKVAPATTLMTDRVPAQVVIPPEQERVVSSPQAGLITSLRAALGDDVKRNDVLALLESPDLIALERDYLQGLSALQLGEADLKRDEQLFNEGIIAERRYLETNSRYQQARATVEERRQALLLAGLDAQAVRKLEQTRQLTSALVVRAPIAGAVLEQMAVVGERVDPAAPLYRIGQLEPLWLAIRVPLDRVRGVVAGAEVSLPCPKATAVVTLVGRNVDPATQTVLVRAEVSGGGDCLRPGQFTEVRMALFGVDQQFRVPSSALVRTGNTTVVFVRTTEGFRPQSVEVLGQDAGFAVVRSELTGDEDVAASGIAAIKSVWLGGAQ